MTPHPASIVQSIVNTMKVDIFTDSEQMFTDLQERLDRLNAKQLDATLDYIAKHQIWAIDAAPACSCSPQWLINEVRNRITAQLKRTLAQ